MNVEKLNLSWNDLQKLPKDSLGKLSKLREVSLSGTRNFDFGELVESLKKFNVNKVALDYARLDSIAPLESFYLTELDLSWCSLEALPEEFRQFPSRFHTKQSN